MNNEILSLLKEIRTLLSLNKRVLTIDEFCIYTGISKNYAYQLTSSGKIKFHRPLGKMTYFDREDIIAFLLQNPNTTADSINSIANNYLLKTLSDEH